MGYLFQNYALFPGMTVEQNIMVGLKGGRGNVGLRKRRPMSQEAREQKVAEMVERFRLHGLEKRYPGQLSGGQQQRAAIARALISDPEILFADEPTGNLDSKTGAEIMKLLQSINKNSGQTIIMVTHSPEAAKNSNRIITVKDGMIE